MKTTVKRWAALALASALTMGVYAPAEAVTMPVPAPKVETSGDVLKVDHRVYYRAPYYYYRGYRGYRHPRPGYRYHNGYWFPLAAFGAGLIIGGALATPTVPRAGMGLNPRHYRWCEARYRSYDPYSNTFQPYHGPRRQCLSPYY
ncbi:BA14K family protein [Ciceribacter ferrooxidans]|uniref:Lectin-like protein BA14k n=1 Tax=Ciceribacter ferrooxidans TaxID=2509717 RepID=A0A4Q2S8U8_9HYPH|nr:BA14K family protein [Ciceribacter ferrooxidans]RYB97102.1 BA14K family protein [Ciceribacter ferrooxidans]